MRLLAALILASLALAGCSPQSGQRPDPVASETILPRVIAEVPHDTTSFTQGLQFVGDELVETTGLVGESKLRVLDRSGKVLRSVDLPPEVFGEGVAVSEDTVYVLTWKNHRILRYSWPGLEPRDELPLETEGWGACLLDGKLWTSDGSARLTARDPATGKPVSSVEVRDTRGPVDELNELECRNGYAWANIWMTSKIASIDLSTGAVQNYIEGAELVSAVEQRTKLGPDSVLNGIAFDEDGTAWLTGKNWPVMFQVEAPLP